MKIRHNIKIQEDGLTLKGQILEIIFEGNEKRGDLFLFATDKRFRIQSCAFPDIVKNILYVHWTSSEEDNHLIEWTYSRLEEAKKMLNFINEYTVGEEYKIGDTVVVSMLHDKNKFETEKMYYVGITRNNTYIVEDKKGHVFKHKIIKKVKEYTKKDIVKLFTDEEIADRLGIKTENLFIK